MNQTTLAHRYDDAENIARLKTIIRRIVSKAMDHQSLVIEIASTIGAEILYGVRRQGSDLNSVDVARQLGTSRTPVREALQILEQEGLVEIPPRRRPSVAVLSVHDVHELYNVRAAIASIVAAEAAVQATDEELNGLSTFSLEIKQAIANKDNEAYYWANVHFQERLTEMAHNATLAGILDTLVLRSMLLKRIALAYPGRAERSAHEHIFLIQALQDRDSNLAAALAKSNVLSAYRILEIQLRDQELERQSSGKSGREDNKKNRH